MALHAFQNPANGQPFESLVDRIDDLAVLPHVVFKVLDITSASDSSPADIEKVVVVDPGFSSKLLVLSNSAAFGIPKRVTSIRDAVMFLGFKAVRNLALTVGVFDLFVGKTDSESLRRREWWKHSVNAAIASRWLATKSRRAPAEDAYTCGLLHLIGKTLMDRLEHDLYEQVIEAEQLGIPDVVAERKIYGFDHIGVAVAASQKWGLPDEVCSGINYLAVPDDSDESRYVRACVALGSRLSLAVGKDPEEARTIALPRWALEVLCFDPEDSDDLIVASADFVAASHLGI